MVTNYLSVDEFLADQPPSRQQLIAVLRRTVLGTRPGVVEIIKWNSPSYVYNGEDRITLNASAKDIVRLVFHLGAATAEDTLAKPTFAGDPHRILRWHSNIRASLAVKDTADAIDRSDAISGIVGSWLDTFA